MSIKDDFDRQGTPKDMPVFSEDDGERGKGACFLTIKNAGPREIIQGMGLDPDFWQIVGRVNTRRWMRWDGQFLYYYKADVVAGESPEARQLHVDDLVKQIRRRTRKPVARTNVDLCDQRTFVFVISDWQIGKKEGNVGSGETIRRFRDILMQAVQQIKGLRKMGVPLNQLAIISTGDLVEGCGDHYAMQTFAVDLDRRSQNKVVRELLTETLLTLVPLFEYTDVIAVAGNHGENRKDGKAFTWFSDNDDVAAPEAVMEAFNLAGWGDRIGWTIPTDELSLVADIGGVMIGVAHGHQFKGGVNAQKKAEDWWRAQDFGHKVTRAAQILVSGHLHHFAAANVAGGRTWLQAPTIDPGSRWFEDTSGNSSIPGQLTFVADADSAVGYDHLRVLVPSQA